MYYWDIENVCLKFVSLIICLDHSHVYFTNKFNKYFIWCYLPFFSFNLWLTKLDCSVKLGIYVYHCPIGCLAFLKFYFVIHLLFSVIVHWFLCAVFAYMIPSVWHNSDLDENVPWTAHAFKGKAFAIAPWRPCDHHSDEFLAMALLWKGLGRKAWPPAAGLRRKSLPSELLLAALSASWPALRKQLSYVRPLYCALPA